MRERFPHQVDAGLWVRNGSQVAQQVTAYRGVQPEEARDLDLLLLQLWLAAEPADGCACGARGSVTDYGSGTAMGRSMCGPGYSRDADGCA